MSGSPAQTIAQNLARIHDRIAVACAACDRDPSSVELVAVSKRQPIDRLRQAVNAGHRCFGENQVQEAVTKAADLPPNLSWHMIGPLQSNKVKAAARLFDTVHSVGREKIARRLSSEAGKLGRTIDVFFQINVGSESSKHGFGEDDIETLYPLGLLENLRPVGLMAIPPFEPEAENARRWFRRLRELRDQIRASGSWPDFPGRLSMGMSHDFEVAIAEGATHVRVGTDIFGPRPERGA